MADKLRVHILSKELGVTSKAIIQKCKVEGIDGVTNHMSTISAGLAETVRQWFHEEGAAETAVETAAPVDLEKVRAKRKRTPKKTTKKSAAAAEKDVEVSEGAVETAAEATPVEAPPAETKISTGIAPPSVTEPPPELPVEPPADAPEPLAPAAEAPEQAAAEVEAPQAPPPPAGPQNVPAPAQMKGPKVIGFAKPDVVSRPTPRATPRQAPAPDQDFPETGAPRRGSKQRRGQDKSGDGPPSKRRPGFNPRRSGAPGEVVERLQEWNERDLIERQERLQSASGRGIHARRARERASQTQSGHVAPRKTEAEITEPIIVHELCAATGLGMNVLFNKFRDHEIMIARNTVVPTDVAETVCLELGVELKVAKAKTALEKLEEAYQQLERKNLQARPPVVAMLGHVDHGKTSLLDAIRATDVAAGEAGGITQHIGAYQVDRGNLSVTFLDTPGHEAFTSMRARGAHMTDVVVLLVAADDGVMPQTIEAINHAKAAKSHFVVALNKIDLPGADVNRVYGQLAEHELAPAEWGGETDVVKTSAITGKGVDELVDHLATLSELLDLKADPTLPACGAVIEAEMKPGMGAIATLLVQEGTLRKGDFVVCGPGSGRVRLLRNHKGQEVAEAPPGTPVEVSGLDEVPNAGDKLYAVKSLQEAKQIANEIRNERRAEVIAKSQRKPVSLADLLHTQDRGDVPEMNLILKADVQGSIDALVKTLSDIPSDEVKLNFLHTGVGSVSESDVVLAEASGALIAGFNVAADASAQKLADTERVEIKLYRVIYNMVDDIRGALEGLLPTLKNEETRGKAECREIFGLGKIGTVAGCMVTEGVIQRSNNIRLIRDGTIIIPTEDDVKRGRHRAIASLRRFKDDAKEVRAGMECGIRIENFNDVKPGDILEAYEVIETQQKLEPKSAAMAGSAS